MSNASTDDSLTPEPGDSSTPQKERNWTYILSFLLATLVGCKLGLRNPHNEITPDDTQQQRIWLGAVLLAFAGVDVNTSNGLLDPHTLNRFLLDNYHNALSTADTTTDNTRELVIVQALEPSEKQTGLFGFTPLANTDEPKTYQVGNTRINIHVETLALRDFGHSFTPTEKFTDGLYAIYDKHKDTEKDWYFHCKAGVNRSFRTAAIFLSLNKLKNTQDITLQMIADIALATCYEIKKSRRCASFNRKNYLIQASFVATTVARVLQKQGRLDCNIDIDKQYGLAKYILIARLEKLRKTRDNQQATYLRLGAQLFGGIPKDQKCNALQKLIDYLNNQKKSSRLTQEDINALINGRTKKVVMLATQELLPPDLQKAVAAEQQSILGTDNVMSVTAPSRDLMI